MNSKAVSESVKSVAKGLTLSALAVISALGAGCDKSEEFYHGAVVRSRTEALDVCAALAYGAGEADVMICSRGVERAREHAAVTLPNEMTTRKRGDSIQTGIELRSLETYRVELSPHCVSVVSAPGLAGAEDAFDVCMAGALDFYSRVALRACGVDLAKLSGAETEFCALKTESARRIFFPIHRR